MKRLFFVLFVGLSLCSCGHRRQPVDVQESAVFLPMLPPVQLEGEELINYMHTHYWDRFDFADTLFIARADTVQMLEAYAAYVAHYLDAKNTAPLDSLMRRASVSRPMLDYFWMLGERVLYDPNSPLRSDELYISVLRAVVSSPFYNQWERISPEHDLKLALQNRVGQRANDFDYTLASGGHGRLYGVNADYVLLFLSNPECPMCAQMRGEIAASPLLTELIERGDLKVIVLYPDEDLTAWRDHAADVPTAWINAYDKGCVITERESYDLRAIPSLYLLDRDKRVLLKDSASVPDVEQIIDARS
ncbi:MAG: DUF5106 domain-containing protein [Alistipes sp.]